MAVATEKPNRVRGKGLGKGTAFDRLGFKAAEKVRKQLGLEPQAMAAFLGVSEKTYGRRAGEGVLKPAESLKLEMLMRVMQTAREVFPDEASARRWLHTPIVALGNATPLETLTNIRGYERVRSTLYQLAYGIF